MRLWARLAAAMALVTVAPLAVTGYRAMDVSTRKAVEASEEILLRDATALATFVETWTFDQVAALGGWMQPFRLGDLSPGLQDNLLMAVFRASPSVVTVALLDAEARPVVPPRFATAEAFPDRPSGTPEAAEQLIGRVPLTEALERGAAVGAPYHSEAIGGPAVPVGVTGPYGDGLVLGAELSLSVVGRLLADQSTPDHAVALLAADGTGLFGIEHPLVDPRLVAPLLRTDAVMQYTLPGGARVRGAVARVPLTDWTVLVVEPAVVAERTSDEIRRETSAVLLGSMALALLVGLVLARTLSEPVARLRDGADALAMGDFERRVDAERGDEIGELARAFNRMAAQLQRDQAEIQAQQAEIAAFNEELQARVEDRTRELQEAQHSLVASSQLAAVAEVGAGMAHELNNPLAAILGITQLLRAELRDRPEEAQLARLEEQASRCRDVVAAMLRFTRGEVDQGEAPVVDLADLLRDVLELVRGPFRQRGVALVLVEPQGPLPARIDPVHGSRVLAQVLNVMRAGLAEGASLQVSAHIEGAEVVVALAPDRPVAQHHGARDDFRAAGLGLWAARRILDEAGGRIDPPGPDDTTWRVVLPRA